MPTHILLSQIILNGLVTSAIYILMALGFTMIFSIMNIVNFAHGEFYMLGGFLIYQLFGVMGLNYLLALFLTTLILGFFGFILEPVIFRPIRNVEMGDFVLSLGLAFCLQSIALLIWGPEDLGIRSFYPGVVKFGLLVVPAERLVVVILSILILIIFFSFIKYTRVGKSMRALSQDPEAALLVGIRKNKIYPLSFGIGCALAAIAGGLISPIFAISPAMGSLPLLKAFVVVILGGLGSIPGAVAGGLILGVGESLFSTLAGGSISDVMGFVIIIIILLVKPSGICGVAFSKSILEK